MSSHYGVAGGSEASLLLETRARSFVLLLGGGLIGYILRVECFCVLIVFITVSSEKCEEEKEEVLLLEGRSRRS